MIFRIEILAAPRPAAPRWATLIGCACLVAAGLSACSTQRLAAPTPAQAGVSLPANWNGATEAPASRAADGTAAAGPAAQKWWRPFGDATLDALVDRALANATEVQVAQARLRQARAARDVAAAALAPSVNASTSTQASRSEGGRTTHLYKAGFDAGWEIDLWGGQRAAVQAAEADARAREATLAHTGVALAAEVASTYIDLRSAQARQASTRTALANQEHTLRITTWRHEAGLATQLDVEQQRTAVEQTRAQLPALATTIAQNRHALAVLTGVAPGASLEAELAEPKNAAAIPEAPVALALDIPAATLAQRADIAAAAAAVQAAAARVQQADAQRLPSLQLSGSIGLNALTLSALTGGGSGVASLLASVSVPLWDQGRIGAQVQQQQAALDEARANHRAAVLGALQEVEDALVALRGAREQLQSRRAAAASARRAATLAEQRYASGLTDFTSVLLTQRTQLAADDDVTTTLASLATQHVRLVKALGGGWSPEKSE